MEAICFENDMQFMCMYVRGGAKYTKLYKTFILLFYGVDMKPYTATYLTMT